jgi:hypothetical protein
VGMNFSTSFHCASVSSCRCIPSVDQNLEPRATMICNRRFRPDFSAPLRFPDQKIRDTP